MIFLDGLNHGTFVFFQRHRLENPWLPKMLGYVTELGSNAAFAVAGVIAIGAALAAGRRRMAVWILAAFVGAGLVTEVTKRLVGAPRPPDAVESDGKPNRSGSFPSGHAMKAAVAYPILALLTASLLQMGRKRYLLYVAAGAIVLLVGFTRIYLGVHYVTDVLGGWAFGLGWMLLCWRAATYSRWHALRYSEGRG